MFKSNYPNFIVKFRGLSSKTHVVEDVTSKLNEKVKGTFFENWIRFWKNVFRDYKEVASDLKKDIKQKPIKSFFIFSGFSFLSYCMTHNPNEVNFRNAYLESVNKMILVHPDSQNKEGINHLRYIEASYNRNQLRRLNLGIASVMWVDTYSEECDTYESNCSYTQVGYRHIMGRIIDFGFLNNWWILSRKMLDYDVNY